MNGIVATTAVAPGSYVLAKIINSYNQSLESSLERLASGLRVNQPSDDISAYFRARELNKLADASATAAASLQDHLSRLETAQDGLSTIEDLLDEMSDLAKEASEETDASVRATLGKEYDALRNSISDIVETTRYDGDLLLSGIFDSSAIVNSSAGQALSAQASEQYSDLITYQILDTRVNPDGSDATDTYHGLNLSDQSAATTWGDVATGQAAAQNNYEEITENDSGLTRVRRNLTRISTNISVISGAQTALENKQSNYLAASSAYVGIDQAEETARYTSMQIQQQAAASFFAQSNLNYSSVIGMLSGFSKE